jgi:hypothetical protein
VHDGDRLEQGAVPDSINNFQGRYAIRHRWRGPIACQNPRRGIWGGPPGGGHHAPQAAQKLAFVPRGRTRLGSFVKPWGLARAERALLKSPAKKR